MIPSALWDRYDDKLQHYARDRGLGLFAGVGLQTPQELPGLVCQTPRTVLLRSTLSVIWPGHVEAVNLPTKHMILARGPTRWS
jgi:hypothetical protein